MTTSAGGRVTANPSGARIAHVTHLTKATSSAMLRIRRGRPKLLRTDPEAGDRWKGAGSLLAKVRKDPIRAHQTGRRLGSREACLAYRRSVRPILRPSPTVLQTVSQLGSCLAALLGGRRCTIDANSVRGLSGPRWPALRRPSSGSIGRLTAITVTLGQEAFRFDQQYTRAK